MTLMELTFDEQVVLLALLGLMARLDGQVSGDEVELLRRVMSELSPDQIEKLAGESARFADADAILAAAGKVTRQEAREVVFELLYDMATRETIADGEMELLQRLARNWGLPSPIAGGDDDDE